MIQFPDKRIATLREIARMSSDRETERDEIESVLFRMFWKLEDGKADWRIAPTDRGPLPKVEGNLVAEINAIKRWADDISRPIMASVVGAGGLREPHKLPEDWHGNQAIQYLATLDVADYTESFRSGYIDRLMIWRKDFEETVCDVAADELDAADYARKSRRGQETVEDRYGPTRRLYRSAVDDAASLWNTGDGRDHRQMTDYLRAKELPGGAKPYANLNRNGLIKHLKSRLYELDRFDLINGHDKWCKARNQSPP